MEGLGEGQAPQGYYHSPTAGMSAARGGGYLHDSPGNSFGGAGGGRMFGNTGGKRQFTKADHSTLEEHFSMEAYPDKNTRVMIANNLGVTDYQVTVWFQNRRARAKQRGEHYK